MKNEGVAVKGVSIRAGRASERLRRPDPSQSLMVAASPAAPTLTGWPPLLLTAAGSSLPAPKTIKVFRTGTRAASTERLLPPELWQGPQTGAVTSGASRRGRRPAGPSTAHY